MTPLEMAEQIMRNPIAAIGCEHALALEVQRLTAIVCPPLVWESNGEAGDGQTVCSHCGEERDEPHPWSECAPAHFAKVQAIDSEIQRELDAERDAEVQRLAAELTQAKCDAVDALLAKDAEVQRLTAEVERLRGEVEQARLDGMSRAADIILARGAAKKCCRKTTDECEMSIRAALEASHVDE